MSDTTLSDHDRVAAIRLGAPDSFPDAVVTAFDHAQQRDVMCLIWHRETTARSVKKYTVVAPCATPSMVTVHVRDGNPTCQSAKCDNPTNCVHAKALMNL